MPNSIDLSEADLETLSEALETALTDPKGKTRYGKIRAEMHSRYAESGTEQDIPTWDAAIKARQEAATKTQTEAEDFLKILEHRQGARRVQAFEAISNAALLAAYETTTDGDLAEELYDHLQSRNVQTADDIEEAPQSSPIPPAGMYRPKEAASTQVSGLKSQPSEAPEVMASDEPRKAHTKALQTIGKGISDEHIAEALGRADQLAHDYLTQCLLAGATLCAAKAATKHGEWKDRIEKVCKIATRDNFGEIQWRQAYRYMKLWRGFIADLDNGLIDFADQKEASKLQDALLDIPADPAAISDKPAVTTAIKTWIGDEGSMSGLLDRLGRAEREADLEEDEGNKDHSNPANAPPPSVQTNFEETLFDERQGLLTRLRHTLNSDVYTTLPKSEWQRAFGEIEPLYQLLRQRAGF